MPYFAYTYISRDNEIFSLKPHDYLAEKFCFFLICIKLGSKSKRFDIDMLSSCIQITHFIAAKFKKTPPYTGNDILGFDTV